MTTREIRVDYLARVEGEGRLRLEIKDDQLEAARLEIFEPPRFFEAFLRGRHYLEVPDITARICGICPVAYQMSSSHAIERALGLEPGPSVRELRRLLYCGEWLESHILHIFFLHLPDFLGLKSGLELNQSHPELLRKVLAMKKTGNDLMNILGGREIHPINPRVGGFYRYVPVSEFAGMEARLELILEVMDEAAELFWDLPFEDFEPDYPLVSLRHPTEYPLNEGRLISNRGLDVEQSAYEDYFLEEQVPENNALHTTYKGHGTFMVGPLARYSLNYDRLGSAPQAYARKLGLGPTCSNPFRSILVRAVEVVYAASEALRILRNYPAPAPAFVAGPPKASEGFALTEAPRGLLYHRYRLDEEGLVTFAKIVAPTSQNLAQIDQDLALFAADRLDWDDQKLGLACEQVIRNYDPCISCATHFLNVERIIK